MNKKCREIVEMIAEGEALGDDQVAHVAKCATCARTVETRDLIRATSDRRGQVQPRPGFTGRAIAGAMEHSARRRRRSGFALLGATAIAGTLTMVFFLMKPQPLDVKRPPTAAASAHTKDAPAESVDKTGVAELIELADVDGSLAVSADWDWLEGPLETTRLLTEQLDDGYEE